ncbi:85/88 kDa calcium-independent phospholipase A2-like [Watersipora subatra]|uniref:85/88 kDa calcium-independent phospholipase A2-like n=1 Tax=Watersipora subatra TaxID=2589382 RepID=UPI00355C8D9A
MNFVNSVVNKVAAAINPPSNFSVAEVNQSSLTQYETLYYSDDATLYKVLAGSNFKYMLVLLLRGGVTVKYYRLFTVSDEDEAHQLFSLYSTRVVPIATVCQALSSSVSKLQDLCNKVRQHQSDSVMHHCVKLHLISAIQAGHREISRHVNSVDEDNCTPLHIACQTESVNDDIAQELINHGANVGITNSHNETPLHLAAKHSPSKLKVLLSQPTDALDALTISGETPLHFACTENQPECVKLLLQFGADPSISQSYMFPIHCAVKINSIECVKALLENHRQQLATRDGKFGATALHWAKTREMITCLLEYGAAIDALSNTKDTPLHIMLKEDRRDCVNKLLTSGADARIPNHNGETPLHIAIPTDDLAMVRSLIVFGANVNMIDRGGNSPRHLVATKKSKNGGHILYTMHMIGAMRCSPAKVGCSDGCSFQGKDDGTLTSEIDKTKLKVDYACDELMGAVTTANNNADGYRVLCLDGGGIRGLILSMILIRLEEVSGISIKDSFDWIAGTSTGGILALALTQGRDARYCLGLYFKLKNQVFCGGKPYSADILEAVLKEEFGENTLMSELPSPRVMVTSLLADRFPPELHLFRNYHNPFHRLLPKETTHTFPPAPQPEEVHVWQAARSTGAAPTFFTASMDRFIDGGLMSNNPTLDALTEIHEFNCGLKATAKHNQVRPICCVVSLGTGRFPQMPVDAIDVYKPTGPMQIYRVAQSVTSLLKMVVEQATQSEGRPAERARAWCSMIGASYFRFSPQLSVDVILDETDEDKLLLVCWETMVYLHHNQSNLVRLANVLNQSRRRRPASADPICNDSWLFTGQ